MSNKTTIPPLADNLLGELLAVIHGDGGHYQSEHGNAKAVRDAIDKYYAVKLKAEESTNPPLASKSVNEIARGAALEITQNTEDASKVLSGPRFTFEEYVAEQEQVILRAINEATEQLRAQLDAAKTELRTKFDDMLAAEVKHFGGIPMLSPEEMTFRESICSFLLDAASAPPRPLPRRRSKHEYL